MSARALAPTGSPTTFTGKPPSECPGWTGSQLTSLPLLNLESCTREQALAYFDNTWTLTELLFKSLEHEAAFYLPPYHQLRHPLVFYYGHPAALYVNKLRVAGLLTEPIDAHYEVLFETGVDEMSWDLLLSQSSAQWPAIEEVRDYRAKVYATVRHLIETHPGFADGHEPILETSQLWALAMCFEHERIHIETSSVLMRELPQPLLTKPEGWVAPHPSVPEVDVFVPQDGRDYHSSTMIDVSAGTANLGKPRDWPSFGWDNEYGHANRDVPAFAVSQNKITNGEYFEFVTGGGYREERFWSAEGWSWRTFRNTKYPTFWTAVGPQGAQQFRLRTLHDVVPMPWNWPAEVNFHEAKAYCAWKAERDGAPGSYRLATEGEQRRLREEESGAMSQKSQGSTVVNIDPVMVESGESFARRGVNVNLAYGSPSAVESSGAALIGDLSGNVWEWCEESFRPLESGFEVHPYYDDFSAPCFDGEHAMIFGGSWASTGDLASTYARFHFRKHFFQHVGFRLVEEKKQHSTASLTETTGTGYESEKLLNEYVLLHFAENADAMPFAKGPTEALRFPQRCAELVNTWAEKVGAPKTRVLDIGCAVGGASFELAREYSSVVGVDFSQSFIDAAQCMSKEGELPFFRRDQGELGVARVAKLDASLPPDVTSRVEFMRGDACNLRDSPLGGSFDACLLANLLCRLPDPQKCLASLGGDGGLINVGGLAVIVSPYTWMEEYTQPDRWLGGFMDPDSGERVHSNEALSALMSGHGFSLLHEEDMPLLIREHERKYQYIVSHATVFRRDS
jgi:5-histidylcysteine sulfoxide synthase/putative 4-mercaptohistidine N1-methyltranferase